MRFISEKFAFKQIVSRMAKFADDKCKYRFKVTTLSDYELLLTYKAKGKMLDTWFTKVAKLMAKKKGIPVLADANPETLEHFEAPEQYLNRIHTAVRKTVRGVSMHIQKDGKRIIRSRVQRCTFIRDKKTKDISIEIKVVGQYVEE